MVKYNRMRRVRRKLKVPKKVRKYVRQEIHKQIEDKYNFYTQLSVLPVSNIASTNGLNLMSEGSGENQRTAERILMSSLDLRYEVSQATAALATTADAYIYRILLVYDRQPNGAGPNLNQLFMNAGAGNSYMTPINPAGSLRYRILYDKAFTMPVQGGVINVAQSRVHVIRKRFKLKAVYNTGNTGAIADVNTGHIFTIIMSDADQLTYKLQSLLRFEDA